MEQFDLESTLETSGIYIDYQRYLEAKGAGDTEIIHAPTLLDDLRKWGKYLLYINDGEATDE